jgi:hypothetical protein
MFKITTMKSQKLPDELISPAFVGLLFLLQRIFPKKIGFFCSMQAQP